MNMSDLPPDPGLASRVSLPVGGLISMRLMACSVGVLNDFEANGYGVLALQPDDMVILNDVPVTPQVPPS